jgi:hypothetical protein
MVSLGILRRANLVEHSITGDVMAVMDDSSLRELGIASLGQRLTLLRAIWELKCQQGLEIGEDDWTPQGEPGSVKLDE